MKKHWFVLMLVFVVSTVNAAMSSIQGAAITANVTEDNLLPIKGGYRIYRWNLQSQKFCCRGIGDRQLSHWTMVYASQVAKQQIYNIQGVRK